MKRENEKSKQRVDRVYGTVNVGEDQTLTVHFDRQTDEIEIVGADKGSTRTERSYDRDSGKPKVVSSVPSDGKSIFTAKQALFVYDWVIAVDTNTRMLAGKKCSVCVSYFTRKLPASCPPSGVPFTFLAAYLIVGICDGVNPEQIGWHLTIANHVRSSNVPAQKIAIVVDSELGFHREINDRKKGYYENEMLPERITMVYSSSDTDNESLGGVMIRMCDRVASEIFDDLQDRMASLPLDVSKDKNFAALLSILVAKA